MMSDKIDPSKIKDVTKNELNEFIIEMEDGEKIKWNDDYVLELIRSVKEMFGKKK